VVAIALGAAGATTISFTTNRVLGGLLLALAAVLATFALVGHVLGAGRESAPRRRSQVNYQVRASIEPSWSSRPDGEVGDLPTVPFPPSATKSARRR
jgi:hypothetical protein